MNVNCEYDGMNVSTGERMYCGNGGMNVTVPMVE
jgi:hypothetical protein